MTMLLSITTQKIQLLKVVQDLDIKLTESAYRTRVSILVCTTWWQPPWWPKHVVAASYPPFACCRYQIYLCLWLFHTHFIHCDLKHNGAVTRTSRSKFQTTLQNPHISNIFENPLNITHQDISSIGSLMCTKQYQETLHTLFDTPQIQCSEQQEGVIVTIQTETILTASSLCKIWLVTEVCNIDFYHNSNKMLLPW